MPPAVTALSMCRLLLNIITLLYLFLYLTRCFLVYPSLCLSITNLSIRFPLRHYYRLLSPRLPSTHISRSLLLMHPLTWLPLVEPPLVLDLILHLQYVPLIHECLYLMLHSPLVPSHLLVFLLHVKQLLPQALTLLVPAHFVSGDTIQLVAQVLLV